MCPQSVCSTTALLALQPGLCNFTTQGGDISPGMSLSKAFRKSEIKIFEVKFEVKLIHQHLELKKKTKK